MLSSIDKLMFWRAGSWIKYNDKGAKLSLRLHHDQLLIIGDTKVLESLNIYSKVKGVYKDDILILITSSSLQETRKLKFQIKSNAAQFLRKLGEHFPVVSHSSLNPKNDVFRYRDVGTIFRKIIEAKDNRIFAQMPPDFENFVKLCLLDPTFPQVVHDTQKILHTEELTNNQT